MESRPINATSPLVSTKRSKFLKALAMHPLSAIAMLFFLLLSVAAGAADLIENDKERALVAGRYGDYVAYVEAENFDISTAKTKALFPLCDAYSRLKRYDKLFKCLDQLDSNIASGDSNIQDQAEVERRAPGIMGVGKVAIGISQLFGAPGYEELMNIDAAPKVHLMRAEALIDFSQYAQAADNAEKALDFAQKYKGRDRSRVAMIKIEALTDLVLANAMSGNRLEALKHLDSLEKIKTNHWETLNAALARAFISVGEFNKALEYMKKDPEPPLLGALGRAIAEGIARSVVGEDDVLVSSKLPRAFMLNRALFETGNIGEAKTGYDNMLQIKQTKHNGDIYWQVLFDRGRISEMEGQLAEAVQYFRQAIEVIEQQRSSINTEASKIGFVGDKQAVYGRLIAVLIEQGRTAEAFDYVERSKSRALVDMLASKTDFSAQNPVQAKLVLAQLDAATLDARVQNGGAKQGEKTAGVRNLQVARQALQSAAPELFTLVTVTSVPSEELKSLVGTDETLVEYYYQGKDLYAFLLDRERLLTVRLDASEQAAQIQGLRKALEDTKSPAWQEGARSLYQRLWQPLEKLVTSRSVVVVAHGALHYLPFAALQDGDGKFLIDRYSLRFLPSASVLKYLRPVMRQKDVRLLALGNPDLDDPRLDLAFAEGEAKLVASLYPTSRVLLRKDASESNFKKAGDVFSRIHFASHGKFQADEPLKSGLYLAKDAGNDGVLTVGELYSMNLNADLVTLSACETGLGKIANGDDVVGLTRGFLYAGSRSIVASLWSVDDQATATLMQAFYGNLKSMNKREALRQAQIKAREAFPHPFFWAAFQLTGRAE